MHFSFMHFIVNITWFYPKSLWKKLFKLFSLLQNCDLFLYIKDYTKFFRAFFCHSFQYLTLQINYHTFYGFLQWIKFLPVNFFTLMLNFLHTFLLIKKRFDAIISVICKFLKQVIFIENMNTWLAKNEHMLFIGNWIYLMDIFPKNQL